MQPSPAGRREFLAAAGCSLTLAALSACAGVPVLHPHVAAGRLRLAAAELDIGLADGSTVLLQGDELPESIYIIRDPASGALSATGATCTHLGCQIRPANTFFRCPCHGSTFTLDGNVVRGPAARPLARYTLHVVDDHIVIELP